MKNDIGKNGSKPQVTAVKRAKVTKRSVILADQIATKGITIGGILVILAVLGILVFLIEETLPLFRGGEVIARHEYKVDLPAEEILSITMDDHKTFCLTFLKNGTPYLIHARTGEILQSPQINLYGKKITSSAYTLDHRNLAFGFADGSISFCEVVFDTRILTKEMLPKGLKKLNDRD